MRLIENILSYFAYYFRPLFFIYFLKIFKKNLLIKKIISVYDPNNIRKKIPKKLNDKYIYLSKKKMIFLLNINDHIGFNFYINEEWNDIPSKLARKIGFNKDDIFIDIGANTGLVSIPFAEEFNCQVIAIEASKNNGKYLKKNIENNNLDIKPVIKFLSSDKIGHQTKLFKFNGNYGSNSFFRNWNPSLSETDFELVENTTLDNEIKDYNINKIKIIKFDIEGYEYEVIKNFKLLNKIQSIIIFEYNVKYLKKIYKDNYSILLKFLDSDFDIYSIDKSDSNEIILKKINPDVSSEVLAIPKKFKFYYKNLIN